jgi:enoyl-CoA hydratase/carnithine racemase
MGMVLEVVPHDRLMDRTRERAAVIASKPPRAMRIAKRLMRNAERMDLPDFLNSAAAYQALMHQTKDHHEAVAAFIEKRKPNFTGR